MKISASIYSQENKSISDVIGELDNHQIDLFHIDCNDNPAVFDDIAEIRKHSSTPIDLHIISAEPEKYFEHIEKAGVEYVTFQYENLPKPIAVPDSTQSKLGLAITSETSVDVFDDYAARFDFMLIMATTPGESGGIFAKENFEKIRRFRSKYPEKRIHVDGGVNAEVSFILRNMGVDVAVCGSYLFNESHIGTALVNLKTNEIQSHFKVRDFMRQRAESPILDHSQRSFTDILLSIETGNLGFTILEDEDKTLEGIITNADIRKGLLKHIDNLNNMDTNEIINSTPVTVFDDMTVKEMLNLIKQQRFPISYLPVINREQKVMGALTFFNLIKGEL
ncbi:CBS domain-containing protein [Bacteroidales bacterium AH-315-I05]|nr:CBS domain-containing protein [Bacteroidales bacterium AH-315-I05]